MKYRTTFNIRKIHLRNQYFFYVRPSFRMGPPCTSLNDYLFWLCVTVSFSLVWIATDSPCNRCSHFDPNMKPMHGGNALLLPEPPLEPNPFQLEAYSAFPRIVRIHSFHAQCLQLFVRVCANAFFSFSSSKGSSFNSVNFSTYKLYKIVSSGSYSANCCNS